MPRPRVVGQRLPALEMVLQDSQTVWQTLTLDWYSQGKRTRQICTGTALWYRSGYQPLPIRWVLTRDPSGKHPPKAIFSTDPAQPATEIIKDFMKRWSLEVTFEEGRAHLDIETQRQWSDRAIERSTPLLFGLFSLVMLFGRALHPDGQLPVAQAAWYRKQTATFHDVLALVRQQVWGQGTFPTSSTDPGVVLEAVCKDIPNPLQGEVYWDHLCLLPWAPEAFAHSLLYQSAICDTIRKGRVKPQEGTDGTSHQSGRASFS